MKLIAPRELTEPERDVGVYVFALISHWAGWVHRRVETLRFMDAETVERRTSVDFTLPGRPTPLYDAAGNPVHCVPLALLSKRPQRGFDVRDEGGKAVPVYSREQNGPISAGVLWAAAQALVGTKRELGALPDGLAKDFWHIAHRSPGAAQRVWESLARAPADDEIAWRDALVLDRLFMNLARDLSQSFLVLTPLTIGPAGDRRVLKYRYEEQRTTRAPEPVGAPQHEHVLGEEGQGCISVSARTVVYDADGPAGPPKPEAGMEIRVWECTETGQRTGRYWPLFTDRNGQVVDGSRCAAGRSRR